MKSSIALRLRELRIRIGFNRRSDMASHLGLPNSTYSAYEGDSGPPKVEWLVELARRGVNLNWLLTGEGEMLLSSAAMDGADAMNHPPPPPEATTSLEVDEYLLAAMIHRVEREYSHTLTPLEKGEIIARLYAASARLTESELAAYPLSRAAEIPER
ncbi:helix-turn-helix domain-containing protein [Niveispirillum fermenti]|uniref:helix-turn-helix domain-containing protein n=1 Tax=Niveispirillum fermenti TaxID=1233113 RepID=UPI003A8BED40